MATATGVISGILGAIPAEEDAAFVAQVGERGRINSRAGSVEVSSAPLTVAAIADLTAAMFPPDKLQTLQETGLAQFDFALPGVEGWFTALAGAHNGDRWLDIRRRKTTAPARVQPVAPTQATPAPAAATPVAPVPVAARAIAIAPVTVAPAAAPPAVVPVAAEPAEPADEFPAFPPARIPAGRTTASDDLADLAGLDFPKTAVDADPGALALSDDLFDTPFDGTRSSSLDGGWRTPAPDIFSADALEPVSNRRRLARMAGLAALPLAGCVAGLLWMGGYFESTPAAPVQTAARTSPPPAAASAPSTASPATVTAQTPAPASAALAQPPATQQPAAPAPAPTATSSAAAAPSPAQKAPSPAQTAPTAAQSAPVSAQAATSNAQAVPTRGQTAPVGAPAAQTARADDQSRSGFSVQVGAVRTREEADRIVTRFVSQGYPAYSVRGTGAAADYYRIRIGTFPDREAAAGMAKQLEGTEGIKPWITKEVPEHVPAASSQVSRKTDSLARQ